MTKEKPMPVISKHSIIGKYAETLPPPDNTSFAHSEINSNEYQAHLERISDFLLPGEGIWWHYDDEIMSIVFHDGKDEPNDRIQGPKLHHFRSSTFASERNYLKEQWIKCLEPEVVLPTCKIKIFDENGDYVKEKVHLSALLNEEQVAIHDKVTNREPEENEILEFSNQVENNHVAITLKHMLMMKLMMTSQYVWLFFLQLIMKLQRKFYNQMINQS